MRHALPMLLVAAALLPGCAGTAPRPMPATPAASFVPTAPATAPASTQAAATEQRPLVALMSTDELAAALRQLAAPSYSAREKAASRLQQATVEDIRRLVTLQQTLFKLQDALTQQLRDLTFTDPKDAETRARVAGLMQFTSGLSAFCADALQLPPDQEGAVLDWGLSPQACKLVAQAYSSRPDDRAAAAHQLKGMTGPGPDWLVRRLLDDSSRVVFLNVLDALYDRPLTSDELDQLWGTVTWGVQQGMPRTSTVHVVQVHGRPVSVQDERIRLNYRMQDAPVVAALLIAKDSPLVRAKLDDTFKEYADAVSDNNNFRWRMLMPNYGNASQALYPLIEAYRPPAAFDFYAAVLDKASGDDFNMNINNEHIHGSMRIDAAAVLLRLGGEETDDYGIQRVAQYGNRYGVKGDNDDVNKALKKVQAWWKQNRAHLVADASPATTKPVR